MSRTRTNASHFAFCPSFCPLILHGCMLVCADRGRLHLHFTLHNQFGSMEQNNQYDSLTVDFMPGCLSVPKVSLDEQITGILIRRHESDDTEHVLM